MKRTKGKPNDIGGNMKEKKPEKEDVEKQDVQKEEGPFSQINTETTFLNAKNESVISSGFAKESGLSK